MAVHAGIGLFQRFRTLNDEHPLGLFVMRRGGVAAGFQNQSQLLLLHRAGIKFPQGIARCGQLFKIHGGFLLILLRLYHRWQAYLPLSIDGTDILA